MGDEQKPARRTRAELRQLMLEAGKEVLLAMEPTMGFDRLSYRSVFDHLQETRGQKVTVGSVQERIWPELRDFQLDVLALVIAETPEDAFDIAESGAIEAFTQADLSTPAGRRYAAQNVTRLLANRGWTDGQAANRQEAIGLDARFRLWSLGAHHPEAVEFQQLITSSREKSTELYLEMIELLMQGIGLRVRPQAGDNALQLLAVIGNAVLVGLLTETMPISRDLQVMTTGPAGELEEWHTNAIALWAAVQHFLELDDDTLPEAERRL